MKIKLAPDRYVEIVWMYNKRMSFSFNYCKGRPAIPNVDSAILPHTIIEFLMFAIIVVFKKSNETYRKEEAEKINTKK